MDHFASLIEEFKDLDNFDRYQNILDWAKDAEVLPPSKKLPHNLVAGCASNLWVDIDQNIIKSDADAVITKGLASMFCDLFNKFNKEDAKMFDPKLLQSLGFVLSPSRANGMVNLIFKLKELKNDIK